MTIAADLSESTCRQAETFLVTLGEDQARHITAVGLCGYAARLAHGPYKTLIHAIVYQQSHVRVSGAILGRFIALYPVAAFPAPQQVLVTDEAVLRACGFSVTKLATIHGIAQATLDGIVPTYEQAFAMPDEAFIKRLVTLHGVGWWAVETLLIYTPECSDILPVDDSGMRGGYRRLKRLDATPTHKQMGMISLAWSPHWIVTAWYLRRVPVNVSDS